MPADRSLLETAGYLASGQFARYWLAECRKIEEQIDDPSKRWGILVDALERIARLADEHVQGGSP